MRVHARPKGHTRDADSDSRVNRESSNLRLRVKTWRESGRTIRISDSVYRSKSNMIRSTIGGMIGGMEMAVIISHFHPVNNTHLSRTGQYRGVS